MVIALLTVFCAESLSRKKLRSTAAELIIFILPWRKVCSRFCGFLQAEPFQREMLRQQRKAFVELIFFKLALKGEDNPEVFTPRKSTKLN